MHNKAHLPATRMCVVRLSEILGSVPVATHVISVLFSFLLAVVVRIESVELMLPVGWVIMLYSSEETEPSSLTPPMIHDTSAIIASQVNVTLASEASTPVGF